VARAAPAAHQVGREIVRRFDGENTRFELRLDPPELGRVEVRLEVSRDHRVTATIAADTPQALAELARHARELEQMLQSAGLELTDDGLSFDLRKGREGGETGEGDAAARAEAGAGEIPDLPPQARPLGFERWRGVRVDMMV
jgi:flagellar hook-length control protein FliK